MARSVGRPAGDLSARTRGALRGTSSTCSRRPPARARESSTWPAGLRLSTLRVLARLPEASVVGVDTDPVLLALARAAAPASLELVDADLRRPDWPERIPAGPYDAVLSTTALHWLEPDALRCVYAACARLLRPGGLLANGDHLHDLESPKLDKLARELDRRRTERHPGDGEAGRAGGRDPRRPRAQPGRGRARPTPVRAPGEDGDEPGGQSARPEGDAVLWRKGTNAVLVALR